MDLKAKKLRIISSILQSDDPEILETIARVLSLTSDADPVNSDKENIPFPAITPSDPADPDVQELQASIDSIFQAYPPNEKKKNAL